MTQAMNTLRRDVPRDSVLVTDYEGGLMLSYYLCPNRVVDIETAQAFLHSTCGDYRVVASSPDLWAYDLQTLPAALGEAQQESADRRENVPVAFSSRMD